MGHKHTKEQAIDSLRRRLLDKIVFFENSSCWFFNGAKHHGGYGKTSSLGRFLFAHRASYEVFKGKIPHGLTIDHLCKNKLCINPEHLEAVPLTVNVMRGNGPPSKNLKKSTCRFGHTFSIKKTKSKKGYQRFCKECASTQNHILYLKKKVKVRHLGI